jgi:hypothetical protein
MQPEDSKKKSLMVNPGLGDAKTLTAREQLEDLYVEVNMHIPCSLSIDEQLVINLSDVVQASQYFFTLARGKYKSLITSPPTCMKEYDSDFDDGETDDIEDERKKPSLNVEDDGEVAVFGLWSLVFGGGGRDRLSDVRL